MKSSDKPACTSVESIHIEFLAQRHALSAFLRAVVRDPWVAEDLFQDVWLELERAIRAGRQIENVPAWCRATARHLASHYWRDRRREPIVDSDLVALVELAFEENEELPVEHARRWRAIERCLTSLPARSRQLISLRYGEGLRCTEIAARVNQTVESIRIALFRLRQALQTCAEKQLRIDTDL